MKKSSDFTNIIFDLRQDIISSILEHGSRINMSQIACKPFTTMIENMHNYGLSAELNIHTIDITNKHLIGKHLNNEKDSIHFSLCDIGTLINALRQVENLEKNIE